MWALAERLSQRRDKQRRDPWWTQLVYSMDGNGRVSSVRLWWGLRRPESLACFGKIWLLCEDGKFLIVPSTEHHEHLTLKWHHSCFSRKHHKRKKEREGSQERKAFHYCRGGTREALTKVVKPEKVTLSIFESVGKKIFHRLKANKEKAVKKIL